jgi:hypothetical protein
VGDGNVRPRAIVSLAILGVTALMVVLADDRLDNDDARGDNLFEAYGLGLLAACALFVAVAATMFGRQRWLGTALVPITSVVAIVGLHIGIARFD